ncbi:PhzF family phenazine biosynthesis protein [Actinomadura sp. 9N407]|uniref:PhzF family phenazine biosynthesis protein n=1 Tax=Actinomadura sp. 9N407 TaxID=3375154 RepID=UPI0037AFB0C4
MTLTTPLPALGRAVLRYSAFSADPIGADPFSADPFSADPFSADARGGNPAGVVLDAAGLADSAMLAIAAEAGCSESAFLTLPPPVTLPPPGLYAPGRTYGLRYFSPKAEVPFCGHATLATAAALAERDGPGRLLFATQVGLVPAEASIGPDGIARATLTSVEPYVQEVSPSYIAEALDALRWSEADLDPALPPHVAYAGARHLILAAATRERLARLSYDFDRLAEYMRPRDLTTVQLAWRASPDTFHVRDPYPVGGVVEDPATGAAAAAFGAYLRRLGAVPPAARLTLYQGEDMGRPGVLRVELREGDTRVRVSGAAVPLRR